MQTKRFLIGKALRKSNKDRISQDEISQAIHYFKKNGGLIKELPPQPDDNRPLVGNPFAAAYETVIEH